MLDLVSLKGPGSRLDISDKHTLFSIPPAVVVHRNNDSCKNSQQNQHDKYLDESKASPRITIISDPKTAISTISCLIDSVNPKKLNISFTIQLSGNVNQIPITVYWGYYFGEDAVVEG